MNKIYDVYGVGNALVDIQARVTDAVVHDLGFAKGMMTLVDEETQQRVLKGIFGSARAGDPPPTITRCAGGSGANTVLGICDFGGRAAYAGKVGRDDMGEFFLEDMRRMKTRIEVPPSEGRTGTCVILITQDAQRTMLTTLGVSATLGPEDIDPEEIARAQYLYVEGYLFAAERTRAAALAAIDAACQHGTRVAFTVSDPFLIARHRQEFWELIRGPVDLLFCNLEEARSLTGLRDPIDCAHAIHQHAQNVALTMSEHGSIIMHGGEAIPIEAVPVQAIDTTGAGDMYAAGLLYGVTNGMTWPQAGHLASHAAARIVTQLGARLQRRFTRDEIRSFMA